MSVNIHSACGPRGNQTRNPFTSTLHFNPLPPSSSFFSPSAYNSIRAGSARAAVSITDCILLINTWPGGGRLWMTPNRAGEKGKVWIGAIGRWTTWRIQSWPQRTLFVMLNWFGSRSSLSKKGAFWVETSYLANRPWYWEEGDCACSTVYCKLTWPPKLCHKGLLSLGDNSRLLYENQIESFTILSDSKSLCWGGGVWLQGNSFWTEWMKGEMGSGL